MQVKKKQVKNIKKLFRSLEILFRSLKILFRSFEIISFPQNIISFRNNISLPRNNLAGTKPLICHLIYWDMKTISDVAVILRADFHLRVLQWRPGFNTKIANTENKYFVQNHKLLNVLPMWSSWNSAAESHDQAQCISARFELKKLFSLMPQLHFLRL